eukprot:6404172-Amphidinium_carterae.5
MAGAPSTASDSFDIVHNALNVVEPATVVRHTHNDGSKTARDNGPQGAQQDETVSQRHLWLRRQRTRQFPSAQTGEQCSPDTMRELQSAEYISTGTDNCKFIALTTIANSRTIEWWMVLMRQQYEEYSQTGTTPAYKDSRGAMFINTIVCTICQSVLRTLASSTIRSTLGQTHVTLTSRHCSARQWTLGSSTIGARLTKPMTHIVSPFNCQMADKRHTTAHEHLLGDHNAQHKEHGNCVSTIVRTSTMTMA